MTKPTIQIQWHHVNTHPNRNMCKTKHSICSYKHTFAQNHCRREQAVCMHAAFLNLCNELPWMRCCAAVQLSHHPPVYIISDFHSNSSSKYIHNPLKSHRLANLLQKSFPCIQRGNLQSHIQLFAYISRNLFVLEWHSESNKNHFSANHQSYPNAAAKQKVMCDEWERCEH